MRYRPDSMRGRPNGRRRSQADTQLWEYLAKVSMKYEVDSDEFFNSLLKVYQLGKCKCGELSIESRLKERDHATFLMTRGWDVVGQFRIPEQLLNAQTNPLKEFTYRLSVMRNLAQGAKSNNVKIRDLRAGMKRLNINARVLEVSQPIQAVTKSGFYVTWANALIADETGMINLSLFGAQIKALTIHDVIQIENAHVVWFKGECQLRAGKHGKISVVNSTANNTRTAYSDQKKLQNIIRKPE